MTEERKAKIEKSRENRQLKKQQESKALTEEQMQQRREKWVSSVYTEHRLEQFLLSLASLFKEHGLLIDACGCCDSPYIIKIEDSFLTKKGLNIEEVIQQKIDHLKSGVDRD